MNETNPPREQKPLLGSTVDEVLWNWRCVVEQRNDSLRQRIRAFLVAGGQREFSWRDGVLLRVRSGNEMHAATAEEIADLRLAINLGNFLVIECTELDPLVLHQVGVPLEPLVQSVMERRQASTPPISGAREEGFLSGLKRLVKVFLATALLCVLCLFLTHNPFLSLCVGEGAFLGVALVLSCSKTSFWSKRGGDASVSGRMRRKHPQTLCTQAAPWRETPRLAMTTLHGATRHDEELARVAAVEAWGNLEEQAPVMTLLKALQCDSSWNVRAAAAQVLGKLGERVPVEPLIRAYLHEQDESVRAMLVLSLGQQGQHTPVDLLKAALLDDDNCLVRETAARTLGNLGKHAPIPCLMRAFQSDKDESVRAAAAKALGRE